MAETTTAPESVNRSVTLEVFATDEQRQAVLNSIRKYRLVCREVYAELLLGQTAGATLSDHEDHGPRLTPNGDTSKLVLALAVGSAQVEKLPPVEGEEGQAYTVRVGRGLAYELRPRVRRDLWPTALSFVWDSIRRDVTTVWTAADPEHTQAKRGWLTLQGARGIAQYSWRGIGFPVATGRPKLESRAVTLKWDSELGAVTFSLAHLPDKSRYYIYEALRAGRNGHTLGTLYLNERDGQIKVTLSYSKPASAVAVEKDRVLKVQLVGDRETLLTMAGPDGAATFDTLSAARVVHWLDRHEKQRTGREAERAACGNPKRSWGSRKGWRSAQELLSGLTQRRTDYQKSANHDSSRRVLSRAVAWRCGTILISDLPTGLGEHPWAWTQWVNDVRYKAQEVGIDVVTAAKAKKAKKPRKGSSEQAPPA